MNKKYVALTALALFLSVPFNANAEGKDGVAANINGEKITVKDIRDGYEGNEQVKSQIKFPDFYEKTLDIIVNTKVLSQAAKAAKTEDTDEFKKQLEIAKDELARRIYLEKKVNEKVTDGAVKKLYEEYKKNFKSETEIKAKHILVDTDAKAKEVIAKLKDGGNFDTLAKEYSKEPADLGYFTKSMMVPEFGNPVFSMKKGQYSVSPIKTQYGFHIVLVEDLRPSKAADFKTAEPQLKGLLAQQSVGEIFAELSKNAKIEKYSLSGKLLPNTPAPAAAPAAAPAN